MCMDNEKSNRKVQKVKRNIREKQVKIFYFFKEKNKLHDKMIVASRDKPVVVTCRKPIVAFTG
jgi:hypothetical protein